MNQPTPGTPPVPPVAPSPKKTNHVLHLLLSLVTFGMWLLVWPCVAAYNVWADKQQQEQYQRDVAAYEAAKWQWQQNQ